MVEQAPRPLRARRRAPSVRPGMALGREIVDAPPLPPGVTDDPDADDERGSQIELPEADHRTCDPGTRMTGAIGPPVVGIGVDDEGRPIGVKE